MTQACPPEIDPGVKPWAYKRNGFPHKERIFADSRVVTFVTVQNGPNRFIQNPENLDLHKTGLFKNDGILALHKAKTSELAVSIKFEAGTDEITQPVLAAPSESTIGGKIRDVEFGLGAFGSDSFSHG